MKKRNPEFQIQKWLTEKKAKSMNVLENISPFPTVVVLLSTDGGIQHAIAIVGQFIFESNQKYAMKLCQESLDWCCGEGESFVRVYAAFRISYNTKGLEVNKKTRKRRKKKN